MQIDEQKCVGCGNCVPVCTMGVISVADGRSQVNAVHAPRILATLRRVAADIETVLITGGDPAQMIAAVTDESSVAATFSDPEAVRRLVGQLKREGLGISVNVSGLADEVEAILRSQGIVRHSIEHSLGVLGQTVLARGGERFPPR